jgi:hypothetical protein
MSIIKSTHSGKKLYWHVQLEKLSQDIYNSVKEFPNNIWALCIYYKVPITVPTHDGYYIDVPTYDGYYKKSFVTNKIRFFKDIKDVQTIQRLLIQAFENSLYVNDPYKIEDISLDNLEMEIAT